MQFSSNRFNRLLSADGGGMGQAFAWRGSYYCPCRNPLSGQAAYGCPNCASKGIVWLEPVAAWAAVLGQRAQRQWEAFGQFESGDQVVTIPADSPLYAAGEYDRVTMADTSEHFNAVLERTGAEALPYPVQSFERVVWLDPVTRAAVSGGLPERPRDGAPLVWFDGATPPPAGVQYTVTGRRSQEFFIFKDLVQDRATGGRGLPRKVVMRRFELFKRG